MRLRTRVLRAIARHRGLPLGWTNPAIRERMAELEPELLAWSSTATDYELLSIRNIGIKGVAWLRSCEPADLEAGAALRRFEAAGLIPL